MQLQDSAKSKKRKREKEKIANPHLETKKKQTHW
jgi:hypothetical protein